MCRRRQVGLSVQPKRTSVFPRQIAAIGVLEQLISQPTLNSGNNHVGTRSEGDAGMEVVRAGILSEIPQALGGGNSFKSGTAAVESESLIPAQMLFLSQITFAASLSTQS